MREETSAKACSYRHMISLNTSGNLNIHIHNWQACELFSLKFTFRPFICFCSAMIIISKVNALHFVDNLSSMIICHRLIICDCSSLSHEQAQTDCAQMQSHLKAVSISQFQVSSLMLHSESHTGIQLLILLPWTDVVYQRLEARLEINSWSQGVYTWQLWVD